MKLAEEHMHEEEENSGIVWLQIGHRKEIPKDIYSDRRGCA